MRGLTTSLPCDLEPILLGVVGDWRLRLGLKSEQSTTIECTFSRNDLCQFVCCVGSQNRIVLTLDGLDRL
jgi:hypothetical protein